MAVTVRPVTTAWDRQRFLSLPRTVYRDEPFWVPPLASEVRPLVQPDKHPFYRHAELTHFLARDGRRTVGRIAACIHHAFNDFHGQRSAAFGLFDVLPEYEYAEALLQTAATWAADRGMEILRGPMAFSTNEECGLLTKGFGSCPSISMPYNPPYYETFVERFGFVGVKDLLAFIIERQEIPARLEEGAQAVLRRTGARIRPVNLNDFDRETRLLHHLYNHIWNENWGYTPVTLEEFQWRAERLKKLVDPELVPILEIEGQPIGFAVVLPNINEVLREIRNAPTFVRIGWLLMRRRAVTGVRVFMLGVLKKYRRLGLDSVLYWAIFKKCLDRGIQRAELSWVLDNNNPLLNAFRHLNAQPTKVYRLYDYHLDGQQASPED